MYYILYTIYSNCLFPQKHTESGLFPQIILEFYFKPSASVLEPSFTILRIPFASLPYFLRLYVFSPLISQLLQQRDRMGHMKPTLRQWFGLPHWRSVSTPQLISPRLQSLAEHPNDAPTGTAFLSNVSSSCLGNVSHSPWLPGDVETTHLENSSQQCSISSSFPYMPSSLSECRHLVLGFLCSLYHFCFL